MDADVGAVVPVGQTIAWLVGPGEKPPAKSEAAPAPAARASSGPERTAAGVAPIAGQRGGTAPQISPKAPRPAKELAVDHAQIRRTGPHGTITSADGQRTADS